jgi:hypothetical protein
VDELTQLLESAGVSADEAARRAEDAVVGIEGALVVARVRDDPAPFQRAIRMLPSRLLETRELLETP